MTRGAAVSNTVMVTKTAGTAASVSFSASSLPSGVTAGFPPASRTPDTACSTALTRECVKSRENRRWMMRRLSWRSRRSLRTPRGGLVGSSKR